MTVDRGSRAAQPAVPSIGRRSLTQDRARKGRRASRSTARAPARIRGTACPDGAAVGCTFDNASRVPPARRLPAAARRPGDRFHWEINDFGSIASMALASHGPAAASGIAWFIAMARALLFPGARRSGPFPAARAGSPMTPSTTRGNQPVSGSSGLSDRSSRSCFCCWRSARPSGCFRALRTPSRPARSTARRHDRSAHAYARPHNEVTIRYIDEARASRGRARGVDSKNRFPFDVARLLLRHAITPPISTT